MYTYAGGLRAAVIATLVVALLGLVPTTAGADPECDDPYTCTGVTGSISLQKLVSMTADCQNAVSTLVIDPSAIVASVVDDGSGVITTTHSVTPYLCYRMTNNTTGTLRAHALFDILQIADVLLPAPGVVDATFFVAPGASLQHAQPVRLTLRVAIGGFVTGSGACPSGASVIPAGRTARWESKLDPLASAVDFVSNDATASVNIAAACASL